MEKEEDKLLTRLSELELFESTAENNVLVEEEYMKLKEKWFAKASPFLRDLPEHIHCWCRHKKLMQPLLEVYSNYREDLDPSSALVYLWARISNELRTCMLCVRLHHEAQMYFKEEYEEEVVLPILNTLKLLDEGRVASHLKDLTVRLKTGSIAEKDDIIKELTCVIFEVLMFPSLLDDAEVNESFKPIFQHISRTGLSLTPDHRYPGLYALFSHADQGVRSIANILAAPFEKFRDAADLEPIQPVLQKWMDCLESSVPDQQMEPPSLDALKVVEGSLSARRRTVVKQDAIWIGLQKLLGLIEPPAFKEGVVERYPGFVSIVLNHVSEATSAVRYPLGCLCLLLKIIGYKLWLGSSFPVGIVRNTLLSLCFHTREESLHTSIFELFQPFLQSLEGLQDGEFERQRRRLLYFLLRQVPASRNFSQLIRRKASQIAFSVVGRGYMLEPPSPALDCAHVWGPSLVASLKNVALHTALRQPAIELMQAIMVADAAALGELSVKHDSLKSAWGYVLDDSRYEDDELELALDASESNDGKCWTSFQKMNCMVREKADSWFCLPLVWMEGLQSLVPATVPPSFSKSVLWAASRISLNQDSTEVQGDLLVLHNGVAFSQAVGAALYWSRPTGCDDGDDGKLPLNAVRASAHQEELTRALKRCAGIYCSKLHDDMFKHLAWEPRIAEPIILLLLDSDLTLRSLARDILRHLSKESHFRSEELGMLCSSDVAVVACIRGLLHAARVLLAWPFPECSAGLQVLFFQVEKLLNLDKKVSPVASECGTPVSSQGIKISSEAVNSRAPQGVSGPTSTHKTLRMLSENVSQIAWPLVYKCVVTGKDHAVDTGQQATFIRVMDILPLVCNCAPIGLRRQLFLQNDSTVTSRGDPDWFGQFASWRDVSAPSIHRRWKHALWTFVSGFMNRELPVSDQMLETVQELHDAGSCFDDDDKQRLSALLATAPELSREIRLSAPIADVQGPTYPDLQRQSCKEPSDLEDDGELSDKRGSGHKDTERCIQTYTADSDLSDDDVLCLGGTEAENGAIQRGMCTATPDNDHTAQGIGSAPAQSLSFKRPSVRRAASNGPSLKRNGTLDSFVQRLPGTAWTFASNESAGVRTPLLLNRPSASSKTSKPGISKGSKLSALRAEHRSDREQRAAMESIVRSQVKERVQNDRDAELKSNVSGDQKSLSTVENVDPFDIKQVNQKSDSAVLEYLVRDEDVDPLDTALDNAGKQQAKVALASVALPRRRTVCMERATESYRPGHIKVPESPVRPPPPKLDDWYRRILLLNYFFTIGISTECDVSVDDMSEAIVKLPNTFKSSDQYVETFRPLLMEEFKAQLQRAYEEMSMTDGMTAGSLVLMSLERVDDFQRGQFIAEAGADGAARACSENDLVLLTKKPFTGDEQGVHILAKVDKRERDKVNKAAITLLLRLYLNPKNSRLAKAKRQLVDRSKWCMTRLLSITPQLREFQALSAVATSPLMPVILCPSPDLLRYEGSSLGAQSAHLQNLQILPDQLQRKLRSEYNESQLGAVAASVRKASRTGMHHLALVQGPPGTGKTRTIVAIVSALLALGNNAEPSANTEEASHSRNKASRLSSEAALIARSWQDARVAKDLMRQEKSSASLRKKQRVLVCAQSNAAVDELVLRFCKHGLYGVDGQIFKPDLVRVGNAKGVHPDSNHVFIDTLVDKRLGESSKEDEGETGQDQAEVLKSRFEKICERIQGLEAAKSECEDTPDKLANAGSDCSVMEEQSTMEEKDGGPDNDAKWLHAIKKLGREGIDGMLKSLKRQKQQLYVDLRGAQNNRNRLFEENKLKREAVRRDILRNAEIVITTLSGCGGDIYSTCMESFTGINNSKRLNDCFFNAVVIDEAAQALEPATLIPLQLLVHQKARCIMVGDPKQLPATVLSQTASKMAFECSMFERLQKAGHPVTLLSIQYRMHPEIRKFPSEHFYENQLIDGETLTEESRTAAFHKEWCFKPYVFLDVVDGQARARSGSVSQSLSNEAEAEAAVELVRALIQRYPSESLSGRLGVITPYKQQLGVLRDRFKRASGPVALLDIEFNTVDGFQGREVDIVIFSTVRASSEASGKGGIGFVADVRRMNVALTRARFSLWIVGNASTLQANPSWGSLLVNARSRGVIWSVRRPYTPLFLESGPPNGKEKMNMDFHESTESGLQVVKYTQKMNVHSLYEPQSRRAGSDQARPGGDLGNGGAPHKPQNKRARSDQSRPSGNLSNGGALSEPQNKRVRSDQARPSGDVGNGGETKLPGFASEPRVTQDVSAKQNGASPETEGANVSGLNVVEGPEGGLGDSLQGRKERHGHQQKCSSLCDPQAGNQRASQPGQRQGKIARDNQREDVRGQRRVAGSRFDSRKQEGLNHDRRDTKPVSSSCENGGNGEGGSIHRRVEEPKLGRGQQCHERNRPADRSSGAASREANERQVKNKCNFEEAGDTDRDRHEHRIRAEDPTPGRSRYDYEHELRGPGSPRFASAEKGESRDKGEGKVKFVGDAHQDRHKDSRRAEDRKFGRSRHHHELDRSVQVSVERAERHPSSEVAIEKDERHPNRGLARARDDWPDKGIQGETRRSREEEQVRTDKGRQPGAHEDVSAHHHSATASGRRLNEGTFLHSRQESTRGAVVAGVQDLKASRQPRKDIPKGPSPAGLSKGLDDIASRKRQRLEAEAIMRNGLLPSSRLADADRLPKSSIKEGKRVQADRSAGRRPPSNDPVVIGGNKAKDGAVKATPGGTSVDDILAGLDSLSASQVKGSMYGGPKARG